MVALPLPQGSNRVWRRGGNTFDNVGWRDPGTKGPDVSLTHGAGAEESNILIDTAGAAAKAICHHALRAQDHAVLRDLVSSETRLPQQGQQVRPHALHPGAGDGHANDHEHGDQCYEHQVVNQRCAT
jgi:hypothetical protein